MKNVIVFLLLASCFCANAQEKTYFDKDWKETSETNAAFYRTSKKEGTLYSISDYYIKGQLQFTGTSSTPKEPLVLEGVAAWYYANGNKEREGTFKANMPNGKMTTYYPNGKIMDETEYANGKKHGMLKVYFPTGETKLETYYQNDKSNGSHILYDSPNVKKEVWHFKNDVPHGAYEIYNDGRLFNKGSAVDGFQDGECIENYYREEDKLRWKYTVKDKLLHGTYYEYEKDGSIAIKGEFKNGVPQSFEGRSLGVVNDSEFSSKMVLKKGTENWEFFRDGKLILQAYYKEGKKTGVWKAYTFDGTKLYETYDYTNADCSVQYLQGAKLGYTTHLHLEERFSGNGDVLRDRDCEGVVVIEMAKADEAESYDLHPFYHQKPYEERDKKVAARAKVSWRTKALEEDFDYKEPARKQEFLVKNNCIDNFDTKFPGVTKCERIFDGYVYKVFTSTNKERLLELKKQLKPAENEILFFYQEYEQRLYKKGEVPGERYMGFGITETMKAALKNKVIETWYIGKQLEHGFFNIDDFMGSSAIDALKREIDNTDR